MGIPPLPMSLQTSHQEGINHPLPNSSRPSDESEGSSEHGKSPTLSEISYYLRYQDNGCFFPPNWMGREPTMQQGLQKNEPSSVSAENGVKSSV